MDVSFPASAATGDQQTLPVLRQVTDYLRIAVLAEAPDNRPCGDRDYKFPAAGACTERTRAATAREESDTVPAGVNW